ncbi:MAG TPA: NUDIX domain-containing protein, partial [Caulobacteraceae bacterium]|nr:NUDIX domain-containing protein [Caulobacteraceae bacterium]
MRPVRPRHAASLILLRPTRRGPEVLMGRRPARSRFAPDVFVFPGGVLDAADGAVTPLAPLSEACARRAAASPRQAQALAVTALRETAEETGVVLRPDLSALRFLARAITPPVSPLRFDARFFIANADQAEGEHAETAELSDLAYRPLDEALRLPLVDVTE